jgi:chromosome segregation ATPase
MYAQQQQAFVQREQLRGEIGRMIQERQGLTDVQHLQRIAQQAELYINEQNRVNQTQSEAILKLQDNIKTLEEQLKMAHENTNAAVNMAQQQAQKQIQTNHSIAQTQVDQMQEMISKMKEQQKQQKEQKAGVDDQNVRLSAESARLKIHSAALEENLSTTNAQLAKQMSRVQELEETLRENIERHKLDILQAQQDSTVQK